MKRKAMHIKNMPRIREIQDAELKRLIALGMIQDGTKRYKMGKCRMLVSPPVDEDVGWHLSISCNDRYPSWDEIAHARYELLPTEIEFVMHLPKPEDYINIHDYTFHLHELGEREFIKK